MMTNSTGRLAQGRFSFLPDSTDAEISRQIDHGLQRSYAWSLAYPDDLHPRRTFRQMNALPMFDLKDAAGVMTELQGCRQAFPGHDSRLMAFDSTRGVETVAVNFIADRPAWEGGFGCVRQEVGGRSIRYTVHDDTTDEPEAERSRG